MCLLPPSHRHGRPLLQETQTQTIFSTVSFLSSGISINHFFRPSPNFRSVMLEYGHSLLQETQTRKYSFKHGIYIRW